MSTSKSKRISQIYSKACELWQSIYCIEDETILKGDKVCRLEWITTTTTITSSIDHEMAFGVWSIEDYKPRVTPYDTSITKAYPVQQTPQANTLDSS